MTLSRRRFLGLGAGAAGASALGAGAWAALVRDHVDGSTPSRADPTLAIPSDTTAVVTPSTSTAPASRSTVNDRVLVVLQLSGGFDGLNTLIPADGRYHDARPTLAIDPAKRVALKGESRYTLHPELAPLTQFWEAGHLAALQSIGFPNASRSHFEALDWWWNGATGPSTGAGWLGRWLDATATAGDHPLRAIALGSGVPALVADKSVATVVLSPDAFALRAPKGSDRAAPTQAFLSTAAPLGNEPITAAIQRSVRTTVEAITTFDQLKAAAAASGTTQLNPGRGADITTSMDVAAQLVGAGIGTKVIYVTTSGFDTHANQLATHDQLFKDVAGAITHLFDALTKAGNADRVMLMTVSEFGRRVAENGSAGTDHGEGNVQFVIGPKVNGGIRGDLDLTSLLNGDVRPSIDVRSLYTAALDWLGGPVETVLDKRYDSFNVVPA